MEKKLGVLKVATTTNYLMEPKLKSSMQEATVQSLKPVSANSQAYEQKWEVDGNWEGQKQRCCISALAHCKLGIEKRS